MEITELTPIADLIARYQNDILYDVHSLSIKMSRSLARQELQKRSPTDTLPHISQELQTFAHRGHSEALCYELFIAWVSLIEAIIEDRDLPPSPYPTEIGYAKQAPSEWINYCETVTLSLS